MQQGIQRSITPWTFVLGRLLGSDRTTFARFVFRFLNESTYIEICLIYRSHEGYIYEGFKIVQITGFN